MGGLREQLFESMALGKWYDINELAALIDTSYNSAIHLVKRLEVLGEAERKSDGKKLQFKKVDIYNTLLFKVHTNHFDCFSDVMTESRDDVLFSECVS